MELDGWLLEYPIPTVSQEQIANNLWGTTSCETLRPYFQYYTEHCRIAFHVHGRQMPAKTHQYILDIATQFHSGIGKNDIKATLVSKYPEAAASTSEEMLNDSIDLVVRLVLMVDVGELRNAFSGRRRLIWKDGPLKNFVNDIFSDKPALNDQGVKLGTSFTARNVARITGFRVELTTNLADHLRLRYEDKIVSIFHHASFLQHQEDALLPGGFIKETIRTLALLFPQGDRDTEKWYSKLDDPGELDLEVLKCGRLQDGYRQIEQYRFWHDRLVILKGAFDESQPKNVSQLWNDRRDSAQWCTLWIVIGLTLFFGLVQSIEGAMQVYKAYQP